MKQRCVIISAGTVDAGLQTLLRPQDYIIACDAGHYRAAELGVVPNLVLGDFDSSEPPQAIKTLVLPAEKDDTDTHYAARVAVRKGFTEVLMLGALGGNRFDHSLANLSTGLWLAKQGVSVRLVTAQCSICYVLPAAPVQLAHNANRYFSLFAMEGAATGVQVIGAKYPLENAVISPDNTLAASNETSQATTTISLQTGSLLLIQTEK